MLLDDSFIEIPLDLIDFSGKVEHTELTDIDRAVAAFFQSVLDSFVVTDNQRRENEEFLRFVARDKSRKIYAGDFSEPNAFLSKLSATLGDKVKAQRNELLPVCYISRDPAISFADSSEHVDLSSCGILSNERDEPYAIVNKSFVILSYRLTALAWNKSTLNRLILGLMVWLRHTKAKRKHVFHAKTMLAGVETTINIEIRGRKDVMTEPVEIDHDSMRLFASSLVFEVMAEVFEAEFVQMTKGKIGIGGAIVE